MIKLYWILCIACFILVNGFSLKAQDYEIIPTKLNSQGKPGDLFLSEAVIKNNSASQITLFMERIVKDLPANWTSCFCYPDCIAPFIDTLWINIPGNSQDSIMPNYGTDSIIPGIGTIVVTLYQIGYESEVDTITFTGSTMGVTSIKEINNANFQYFPNPATNVINIHSDNKELNVLQIFNMLGEIQIQSNEFHLSTPTDISFLKPGLYFLVLGNKKGQFISQKLIIKH